MDMKDNRISELERKVRQLESEKSDAERKLRDVTTKAQADQSQMKQDNADLQSAIEMLGSKLRQLSR